MRPLLRLESRLLHIYYMYLKISMGVGLSVTVIAVVNGTSDPSSYHGR